ncbi:DNA-methyltransferase [Nocardia aurea]|uniref:DNA-methyltransferase n=1 Tax=Nocardia aurea TaxID=2144174 RepID=UPI0033AA1090
MKPYYTDESVTLHQGDCLDVLRELSDGSADAAVCDPPYALEFMGKAWDGWATPKAFQSWCESWATECLRVLKPGGHLLAFGGSRTWHRLASAVEDAGFEIRDSIAWLYGSGFPKSMDVAKAIDRQRHDRDDVLRVTGFLRECRDRAGVTNRRMDELFGFNGMASHWTALPANSVAEVPSWQQWLELKALLGFGDEMDAEVWRLNGRKGTPGEAWDEREQVGEGFRIRKPSAVQIVGLSDGAYPITSAATEEARRFEGWGTALKPAFEPIVVGRKPLVGTVAQNAIQHGTGALHIDACRTGADERTNPAGGMSSLQRISRVEHGYRRNVTASSGEASTVAGRWPTNVVLDHTAAAVLDEQTGTLTSGKMRAGTERANRDGWAGAMPTTTGAGTYGDSGGASRFFPVFRYEAKASSAERPEVNGVRHPTVKPLDFMRWLVRLVTPPGGLVLDPFAGSGTTAEACVLERFRCIAIEREPEYLPLIVARLSKPIALGFDFGEVE